MGKKATFEEDRDKPDEPGDHCLQTADGHGRRHVRVRTNVGSDGLRQHLSQHSLFARRLVVNPKSLSSERLGSQVSGGENPRFLLVNFQRLNLSTVSLTTEPLRRRTVEQEKDSDEFHDSESDVYDLFNACNGAMRDGFLDVNKLNELSPEEAEALNVPRLKEIWRHTKSGCPQCKDIIRTLNLVRGSLGEAIEELFDERAEGVDVDVIDSIS
jgi:hypothetical protein